MGGISPKACRFAVVDMSLVWRSFLTWVCRRACEKITHPRTEQHTHGCASEVTEGSREEGSQEDKGWQAVRFAE